MFTGSASAPTCRALPRRVTLSIFPGVLAEDLRSGVWEQRYGSLLEQENYDAGYRLVVSLR